MSFRLEKIHILNYKSIEDAEINFEKGFNIFIGENGSGKSNTLQFINSFVGIQRLINQQLRNPQFSNTSYSFDLAHIDKKESGKISLSIDASFIKGSYDKIEVLHTLSFKRFEGKDLKFEESIQLGAPEIFFERDALRQELNNLNKIRKNYIKFNLPKDQISSWVAIPNKFEIDSNGFVQMNELCQYSIFNDLETEIESLRLIDFNLEKIDLTTANLKEEIFVLFETFKKTHGIDDFLNKYSPIEEIRLNKNVNTFNDNKKIFVENLIIEFKLSGNWVSWNYLSDGTKRLFYLITESLSLKEGILLIEEPELGIHPHQLYSIMNFLKDQSSSKQIIISTHSPIVLDILKPEELKSIIITKMTPKGTKLSKLNKSEVLKAKEYMQNIGDLSAYWLHSDLEKND